MNFLEKAASRFASKVVVFFISLAISIIIARCLGPTGKGIYALIFLIPAIIYTFGEFGLGFANTYFAGRKKFKLKKLVSNSLSFGLFNGIALIILFLIFYKFFGGYFFKGIDIKYIYLVLIIIPFSLINNYLTGILFGKHKIKQLNFLLILPNLLNLLGIIFLLLFLKQGIFSLILLSIAIGVITTGISIFFVKQFVKIKFRIYPKTLKKSLKFGIKGYFANMSAFLNYRSDMLLVNFFTNITNVGFYSLAVNMAEMIWYLPKSIATIVFPEVSSSNKQRSDEIIPIICRNTLFLTFIAVLILALVAKTAVRLLYGVEFLPAVNSLLILLPGIMFCAIPSVLCAYINGRGKPQITLYISLIGLSVNIILDILLIPFWGIEGAALATTISYIISSSIVLFVFLRMSNNRFIDTVFVKLRDFNLYKEQFKKWKNKLKNEDG